MSAHSTMTINGLHTQVNLPNAPEGDDVHSLPPYHKIQHHKVDEYPACPTNWMHGSGKASSYFFPVQTKKHLWLDFNQNWNHTHHVAIVMSIQGINPITGQQSKVLRLEQYRDKCPIHDVAFKQDRFCEKCANGKGFKWPSQNYMTTVSTPKGQFWIDGWRAEANKIRGFLITAETMKGIATQLIGDDRVWAIGIAFYLSKEPKPQPVKSVLRTCGLSSPVYGGAMNSKGSSFDYESITLGGFDDTKSLNSVAPVKATLSADSSTQSRSVARATNDNISVNSVQPIETEKLEIGGGAKISQELAHHDPSELSFYQDEPAGIIYGNYCSQEDFEKIIAAGVRDMTANGEGFMDGLETGNPVQTSSAK